MKYTNMIAINAIAAVLGGGSLLAADGFFGHDYRVDVRVGNHDQDHDRFWQQKEDLRRDEAKADSLRFEIARDRERIRHDQREGRRFEASRAARELERDEHVYRELMEHIARDRARLYGDDREYRGDSRGGYRPVSEPPAYPPTFGYRR